MLGKGERVVAVIVDGNNHDLMVDGKRAIIRTTVVNNQVTIAKCKEIVANIQKQFDYTPKHLKIHLHIYGPEEENQDSIFGVTAECLLDSEATYNVKNNCLRIWKDKMPIYENYDGVICKDPVALADSLL